MINSSQMIFSKIELVLPWISFLRPNSLIGLLMALGLTNIVVGQTRPGEDLMQKINQRQPFLFEIEEERVKAVGIKRFEGKHSVIYTDVRDRKDIEELTKVFDLAVKEWCLFFSVDQEKTRHWKMRAYIMEDEARFGKAGLMPHKLPEFPAGYQLGRDMWVYVQPGQYYTRHLFLHEGTHAFMSWFLNGTGAPWFSEGMAEKLALNHWDSEKLEMNFDVSDRNQVPHWGRVKLVRRDLAEGKGFSLAEVLQFPATSFREVNAYGWSWAACDFLSKHPLSKDSFIEWFDKCDLPVQRFDVMARNALKPHWNRLELDWEIFVNELDYGSDIREIHLKTCQAVENNPEQCVIKVDSQFGWQSSGFAVSEGDKIQIEATGRCQMGATENEGRKDPWISSSNGISLQHPNGRRLGLLLAGIVKQETDTPKERISSLLNPIETGEAATFTATQTGILVLRINDFSARLHDNQGTLEVTIKKVK